MKTLVLEVEERTTLGKKVKALRRSGTTPANIFGHAIQSQAIQVDTEKAEQVLAKAGATQLITLKSPSFNEGRMVLTAEVQRDFMNGKLLHIDFHEVSMKDKVKVVIPLVFTGEAPASRQKELVLLESLTSLEIECFPNAIPDNIAVDLSKLEDAGDHILVKDLQLSDTITVLTHGEEVIARIGRFAKAEAVAKVAEEAEGAPAAEGAAGKAGAEKTKPQASDAAPAKSEKKA